MLALTVQVPAARDRTATATLRDGLTTIAGGQAVATATVALATQRGNAACDPLRPWGHPPGGRYRLLNHEPTTSAQLDEYGSHLLLFEPQTGEALEAESFGRLGLLVYGGAAGSDGRMRATQGGLRLKDAMLDEIVRRLRAKEEMSLELVPVHAPAWWQFWKERLPTLPLSSDTPALAPPADELSLSEALLQKSVRRPRTPLRDRSDDMFDRSDRYDRSSSSSSSGHESFEGKGGTSGGAGAGGDWSDTGRGRGVDSSGRIVATAAAVGAVGALAAIAAQGETRATDSADTPNGSSDSSDSVASASSDTTTTTAY
jgi:uncharacterized membrane protein YgcG